MPRAPFIPPTPSEEAYSADADQGEVFTSADPFELFEQWFALARAHEINDANAMALATADREAAPDVRMVLLKDFDPRGLSFYTSETSAKGRQIAGNHRAAALFHWKSIRRQVRFRGPVEKLPTLEADAYFAERARGARIAAWASKQSAPLADRAALDAAIAAMEKKFEGKDVPRPDHWIGYRLVPEEIEFWVNRPFRLHDRLLFTRSGKDGWNSTRLYP
ncbi:MAG: pyridoxamine 5'-phosphate oxidase [Alphaproteobacteria bacterium]|nr:pyridoxamine 5'-phosphate oxidase [Alphaproteobacteria bacterium]